MKSKPGAGKLQPLVDLGEEQGYLTLDQINDLLPPDVVSPAGLRTALKSFEDLDLKILNKIGDQEGRENVEPDHEQEEEESTASVNESADPIRLYLKEMAQFKLLTREGEVAVARRIEAGRADVVKELLNSPIILDHIIHIGELLETGDADLSIVLESDVNEADAEAGAQDEQAQRERLLKVVRKLTVLRQKLKQGEAALRASPDPRDKARLKARHVQLKQRVRDEFEMMQLSPRIEEAVISEMNSLLEKHRRAQRTIEDYESATGRSARQLLREAADFKDRDHPAKGGRKNLADIAARIREARNQIRQIEHRIETTGDQLAQSLHIIEAGQASSQQAKKELTQANLRLVVSLGRRYNNRGLSFLDLIQEGSIGLMRAVDKFDYKRGYKFSTYATWWIRQSMSRAIADQGRTIRIPIHMVEKTNKLLRVTRFLVQRLGREPTLDEIARELEMPVDQVQRVLRIVKEPISLETPIGESEDGSVGDFVEDEVTPSPVQSAIHTNLGDCTRGVLAMLTPREEQILRMRFGIDRQHDSTLEEVGRLFSVTRERIRQIEAKALRKLRTTSRTRNLQDFLQHDSMFAKNKGPGS